MQQTLTFDILKTGATFSPCRRYRYELYRIWDDQKPLIMFIGLNPSTANEFEPDNTIKRVVAMARGWGYGGVYMMNLFCFVTAYPDELDVSKEDIALNDQWLRTTEALCDTVVFAWGAFKQTDGRAESVIRMFPNAMALHINKNGSPKHPLYCRSDSCLIKY